MVGGTRYAQTRPENEGKLKGVRQEKKKQGSPKKAGRSKKRRKTPRNEEVEGAQGGDSTDGDRLQQSVGDYYERVKGSNRE